MIESNNLKKVGIILELFKKFFREKLIAIMELQLISVARLIFQE